MRTLASTSIFTTTTTTTTIALVVSVALLAVVCGGVVEYAAAECSVPSQRVQCGMKACNAETKECGPCAVDSDCFEGVLKCNLDVDNGTCEFKHLSETFSIVTLFAPLMGILVCAVGVVAGVGGGAILVPAYFAILQFPITAAVALSQATICGQASVNMYIQMKRRDPNYPSEPASASRPVINYEFLLLMLPFSLVGTLLGNMGGKIAPDWLRVLLLVVMLGGILYRLVDRIKKLREQSKAADSNNSASSPSGGGNKAVSEREIEMETKIKSLYDALGTVNSTPPLEDDDADDYLTHISDACGDMALSRKGGENILQRSNSGVSSSSAAKPATTPKASSSAAVASASSHREPEEEEGEGKPQYPTKLLALIVVIFFAQLLIAYIKTPSTGIVDCGSAGYFTIVFLAVVWNSSLSLGFRAYLSGLYEKVQEGTLPASAVPFSWSTKTTVIFPAVSVVAGAAASMFGIGGGMILNFLLLEAGITPEATSATGGLATFLVASQAALLFIIQGQLQIDYGIMLFFAGIASTLLGQKVVMVEIRRRKMTYLIVVALLAVMVGSMVSQAIMGLYKTVLIMNVGGPLGLGSLCPK